ncbi:MAG: protein-arginine deiminase family protein [Phycisphaerae bacterium]|nr:protein-arginine deiminase family protein [Phycisphaerae bacterium]
MRRTFDNIWGSTVLALLVVGCLVNGATAGCGSSTCPADLNGDGDVTSPDLAILLSAWGSAQGSCADLDDDGNVDAVDLAYLLRDWGPCPTKCPIDIKVDVNRDNVIDDLDDEAEDEWTVARGAFYLVNVDDDKELETSDCVEYDRDEHVVVIDEKINVGDTDDITPFVISAVPNLGNLIVTLSVASVDQIRAIHIFPEIAEGTAKIWGGRTEANPEIIINGYLSETDETTLGLEGLKYRLVDNGVAGFTADMLFDGFVQLKVECVDAITGAVLGSDEVLVKAAPWIALPNTLPAEHVFAREFSRGIPAFNGGAWALLATPNDKFIEDLASGLPANEPHTFTTDTQWAQDDMEIGFSATPRSKQRVAAYTLHHGSSDGLAGGLGDALWRREILMGVNQIDPDIGHYRNPRDGTDSGDYGGNIEVLPPTCTYPLGRLCVGNTISDKKEQFFESQEVQPPFEVDTEWLMVGHVDETVTFWRETPLTVIVASPRLAYQTLGFPFPAPFPADSPGGRNDSRGDALPDWATFFSIGDTQPGTASGGSANTLVDLNANFLSPPIPWRFVRFYDGPCAGQIAHIVSIPNSHTLVFDFVWDQIDLTSPIIGPPSDGSFAAAPQNAINYSAPVGVQWHRGEVPTSKSHYVLVEDTYWWDTPPQAVAGPVFPLNKVPSTITLREFNPTVAGSNGDLMRRLNIDAQSRIDGIRTAIENATGGAAVTWVEVPVLYTGRLDATNHIIDRTAVAWTPGAANGLVANGRVFVARQHGPRFRPPGGAETVAFEDVIRTNLGVNIVVFVEDVDHYHQLSGEVHCGTNVLRGTFTEWWLPDNQPAGIPDLP